MQKSKSFFLNPPFNNFIKEIIKLPRKQMHSGMKRRILAASLQMLDFLTGKVETMEINFRIVFHIMDNDTLIQYLY
jgi:hypothetical protein